MFAENFNEVTTARTLNNIKKSLIVSLKSKYNIDNDKTIDEFLKIHGLNRESFDFISSIERVMQNRINDVSIDSNSNKNEKTIEGINQECIAPVKKAVGYDYLYRTIKELYGKPEAKRLMGEMFDLSLGLSDSTQVLKVYCWALDASKIVTMGREFGQLHSKPSKRVSSYVSALCETIHQMSNHLAGALAISTYFLDISHLSLYKEKVDLRELKTNKKFRKYLENEMQQFVHSVNHLSRSGNESPFTNISVFDRTKLKTLLTDMNWYFPFEDLPIEHTEYENDDDKKEFYTNYIIDYIIEIQNIFLDFFDKGDPLKGGIPYRFPVCTVNFGKKKWGDKEIIQDDSFLRSMCKRDIYRYNIFVSEGTKCASCCRLINNVEMMDFASQSNSFGGGGSISLGSHRVCTINFNRIALEAKTKEDFYNILNSRIEDAAKILKSHKELIKKLEKNGLQPFLTNGWININRLFSTFGIMGIYEATKLYKEKFGNGTDIEGEMLVYMNDKVKEYSIKYEIIGNIEQIPGESFASRLCNADKLIYGEKKVPYVMYSNQFVPLWEEATIWDKMDIDGKYNKLITGGGIVHVQIGEKVTAKQAEKIIRYAITSGCEHFALNAVYSECEKNHNSLGKFDICPECQAKIIEYRTRVVGFFVPVSSWDKNRREWEFPRRKFSIIE
jgi:anaerobic ribonucleoside-triphosphate reductase